MHSFMATTILALYGLLAGQVTAAQVGEKSETRTAALTNKPVLDILRAGLCQEVLIAKIKSSGCNLDTSPTELKELKTTNLSEEGIMAMAQAPEVVSRSSAPGVANVPADTDSRRIQNIAPEEMWNRITQCVFPKYPALAIDPHITGTVDIGLGVSPEGDVGNNSRVLEGPPLLVQSAMDAIRQWKFRPNIVQGVMGLHSGELAGLGNAAAANFGVPRSPKLSARIAGAKSTAVVPSVLKRTRARTRDQ